jgi:hypothetical protein
MLHGLVTLCGEERTKKEWLDATGYPATWITSFNELQKLKKVMKL